MKIFYLAVCFLLGIMLGNVIYSMQQPREIEPEECLSVCVEAYNESVDYD